VVRPDAPAVSFAPSQAPSKEPSTTHAASNGATAAAVEVAKGVSASHGAAAVSGKGSDLEPQGLQVSTTIYLYTANPVGASSIHSARILCRKSSVAA